MAPTVFPGANTISAVDALFHRTSSFSDPGADDWTGTVNFGDGTGTQALALNADKSFTLAHTYSAEGNFTVTISINDGDRGVGVASFQINVFLAGFTFDLMGRTMLFAMDERARKQGLNE